jgi:hypothetical protein
MRKKNSHLLQSCCSLSLSLSFSSFSFSFSFPFSPSLSLSLHLFPLVCSKRFLPPPFMISFLLLFPLARPLSSSDSLLPFVVRPRKTAVIMLCILRKGNLNEQRGDHSSRPKNAKMRKRISKECRSKNCTKIIDQNKDTNSRIRIMFSRGLGNC